MYVLSHSAGGIVSSLIADEPVITKLLCFGYPFKHPDEEDDLTRTEHLQLIKKPFLIIQGHQDVYGGPDVANRYALAPSVSISFIEADHDYENLSKKTMIELKVEIAKFFDLRQSQDGDSVKATITHASE